MELEKLIIETISLIPIGKEETIELKIFVRVTLWYCKSGAKNNVLFRWLIDDMLVHHTKSSSEPYLYIYSDIFFKNL